MKLDCSQIKIIEVNLKAELDRILATCDIMRTRHDEPGHAQSHYALLFDQEKASPFHLRRALEFRGFFNHFIMLINAYYICLSYSLG